MGEGPFERKRATEFGEEKPAKLQAARRLSNYTWLQHRGPALETGDDVARPLLIFLIYASFVLFEKRGGGGLELDPMHPGSLKN